MMQQQAMAEQNQTNQQTMAQPMPQQMVLCPVRVVYETQILMQPDQMQPNQTFFINPQNQPPWAHNRQMPNQVFYVQHPANNIMPSMPQHMEQNHFYVQQPYQQIVQHPMLAQNQENIMRSYQMQNVMTTNMIQNVQNNIGANFQSQHNDPVSNYSIINSNVGSNIPVTQTNTMPVDRQHMIMQGNQNHNVTNQKQMYTSVNVGQQSNQQGIVRSQLMTLNPMQQPSSSVQMFDQTNQVQSITTNTSQLPQVIPRTFVSTKASAQPLRMRTVTLNNVTPTNIRTIDQNYTCRPIKPRPEYRPNTSCYPNTQIQVPQVINTVNVNPTIYNKVPNLLTTAVSNNDANKINRKRKSESPDALNPKLTVVNANTTIAQPLINSNVKSIDVGINTSPIHKPINYTLQNTTNNDTMNRILIKAVPQDLKSEDHKRIDTQKIKQEHIDTKPDINTKDVKQDDNTKIVRYTVFPQARVRATEEVKLNVLKDTKNIINADDKKVEAKVENSKILLKEKILSKNDDKNSKVNETLLTGVNANVMTKDGNEKGKEFVLTHVLDGLVIQESNIAFPIRDSTKKTAQAETKSSDKKPEVIKVDDLLKNNCLELPISDRTLQEKVKEDKDIKEDSTDNPFVNIDASTVKSWTIDQLTSYLSKYKWDETISLLQDHEIDGESLFLVTKSQLMQIGIKENHADIICEYAKS